MHLQFSLRIGSHLAKGSPECLGRQLQMGLWPTTWHCVLRPQVPRQGSMHFWLLQARFRGQSELSTHSGLQDGGVPKYPWTQLHTAWPFTTRHWLLGPQGEGLQGSCDNGSAGGLNRLRRELYTIKGQSHILSQRVYRHHCAPLGGSHQGGSNGTPLIPKM